MSEPDTRLAVSEVWDILDTVADPEIPVISLVDLGVIRGVSWQGDTLVIAISPTYSGCPATAVINLDIEAALRAHGIVTVELRRQLSPSWTTDWMSEKGREQLRAYGIAPPPKRGDNCAAHTTDLLDVAAPETSCPHCNSGKTRKVSQFGSTPCKASYVCLQCREPFEAFKCI